MKLNQLLESFDNREYKSANDKKQHLRSQLAAIEKECGYLVDQTGIQFTKYSDLFVQRTGHVIRHNRDEWWESKEFADYKKTPQVLRLNKLRLDKDNIKAQLKSRIE